jgi:hypothetical protein
MLFSHEQEAQGLGAQLTVEQTLTGEVYLYMYDHPRHSLKVWERVTLMLQD